MNIKFYKKYSIPKKELEFTFIKKLLILDISVKIISKQGKHDNKNQIKYIFIFKNASYLYGIR